MRDTPALYLAVEAAPASEEALAAILRKHQVASVLIRPVAGATLDPSIAKRLVNLIQRQNVAAIIEDDAPLARALKADGVHLTWNKDPQSRYAGAREIAGDRFIVGADAGRSRDDAMTLGEAGADYIGFGIPPHVEDRETARQRRRELVDWWAEIFEIPCVAFDVEDPEEAARLVAANADFIVVSVPPGATPDAALRQIEGFAAALAPAKAQA